MLRLPIRMAGSGIALVQLGVVDVPALGNIPSRTAGVELPCLQRSDLLLHHGNMVNQAINPCSLVFQSMFDFHMVV